MNEIEIIKGLQTISNPILDSIMKAITFLGDQYVFIGIAALLYWLVSKKEGFKLVIIFIFSAVLVEGLKVLVRRTRPYDNGAVSIGTKTDGYSFPSGHSQAAAVNSTFLYVQFNKRVNWLKWVLLANIILVPFSRMYLGQHYLTDVIVGLVIGIVMTIVGLKIIDLFKDKEELLGLAIGAVLIIFAIFMLNKEYESVHNIFVAAGGFSGFVGGYYVEKHYVRYENNEPEKLSLLFRALIGLIGVFALQQGLKFVFPEANLVFDFIRYFLVGLWATLGAMSVFKALKI